MTATLKAGDINIETYGHLPSVGESAPDFILANQFLADVSLRDFAGKSIVMNIFPSLNTPVCACSMFEMEKIAVSHPNIYVMCISADLTFAQKKFLQDERINGPIIALSTFRSPGFGKKYGIGVSSGPMTGLLSRAIFVINKEQKVHYVEQVQNMLNEPDYVSLQMAIDSL